MPEPKAGDWVSLRSGRYGRVLEVRGAGGLAMDVDYVIRLSAEPSLAETTIVLDGLQITAILTEHYVARRRFGLTAMECDILDEYTGPKFRSWNQALRSGFVSAPMRAKINALSGAIAKVTPKFSGKAHRGLKFTESAIARKFLADFVDGKTYTTPQFFSTSTDASVAYNFAGGNHGVFIIVGCAGANGANLRPVTGNADLGEREVLFPPGTTFNVQQARETKEGEAKYTIALFENGAPPPLEKFSTSSPDKL